MASTQASDKWLCNNKVTQYDHDPADSTVATEIGWVDMRDYSEIVVITFASALTGTGVTAFTIIANDESDGSGTDVAMKAHAVGSAPDAVGDSLVLSCTAEEIGAYGDAAGVAARYVTAVITCNNAADEQVVTYIQTGPRFAQDALTADVVA